MIGCTEDIETLLLIVLDDHFCGLRIRSRTNHRGKSRSGTIDEFDAALTQDRIIGRADPNLTRIDVGIFCKGIEIRFLEDTDRLFHLIGEESSHTGIQKGSQIG